jgi:3-hydroxyacyl-[acyl-carrier-protein] dehydratase
MECKWYNLKKIEVDPGGGISAVMFIPFDSPWFSGHFPGNPILPAIAQLAIVLDIAKKACGLELIPKAFKRTKYRRIIRPGEPINVFLYPVKGKAMTYSFQLAVYDEIACKGLIKTDILKH